MRLLCFASGIALALAAPVAAQTDGVGEERYARWARVWNGADLDLAETYAWGWQELTTITGRISTAIRRIFGEDVPPAQAKTRLDADPAHSMVGAEATREWLQKITDDTVATFDGRRRVDFVARTVGQEVLVASRTAPFAGPALRCIFEGVQPQQG